MKHILLSLSLFLATQIVAENIAIPADTIITKTEIIREINTQTKDSIIRTIITEYNITDTPKAENSYIIDENNKKVSFFWERSDNNKKDNKTLSPHWSGFGMSFMNYNDKNVPHGALKMSSSFNFTFNFFSFTERLGHSNFMFVTGVGTDWAKYKFDENVALTKVDRIPQFVPAPEGVNYVSSKLTAYYISIPLLLEYQTSSFHFSAGALCLIKWHSKSQTRYYEDVEGYQIRHKTTQGNDMVRPIDVRLRGEVGINNIGIYAYYAPMSLFKSDKAPKVRTYSIGMMLHF